MSTSDVRPPSATSELRTVSPAVASDRVVAAETAGAAILTAVAVAVISPGDVWLRSVGLHPIWIPIFLLAARYGTRGLLPALALGWGALSLTALVLGNGMSGFGYHLRSTADLIALVSAVLVAWTAMLHENRTARADRRLGEVIDLQKQTESTVKALYDNLGYLRARHDRVDIALSLWRDLAGRIEGGDPSDASTAVLELCEIRTGATAGIVQVRDGNRLVTVACRGQWSPTSSRPSDITIDRTVRTAMLQRQVTPACPGSTEDDCDVAVPVLEPGTGNVVGVIALRGVTPQSLRAADLGDLVVLARWLAPALGRPLHITAPIKKLDTSTGQVKKLETATGQLKKLEGHLS